jgi:hypothetical protein
VGSGRELATDVSPVASAGALVAGVIDAEVEVTGDVRERAGTGGTVTTAEVDVVVAMLGVMAAGEWVTDDDARVPPTVQAASTAAAIAAVMANLMDVPRMKGPVLLLWMLLEPPSRQ